MADFSALLVTWQRTHGRHDLPWQNTRDPYALWVSEIMLQQTQVAAVIPYYQRFMAQFPDLASLARADENLVLQHWSGLGYYSRARNLQRAAQIVMDQHGGRLPQDPAELQTLPGIGRSTAAAILAFAFGQRQAILDGNVKRVLARCFGIAGWPGQPAVEKRLWALAESLLPQAEMVAYTQGLMDLGATLCTRGKPRCAACPLAGPCVARRDGLTAQLPTPKPRKAIPQKDTVMLLLQAGGEVLLEKRPPSGIWGGLWSLPEISPGEDPQQAVLARYGLQARVLPALPDFTHAFTHFRLRVTPQPLQIVARSHCAQEPGALWLAVEEAGGAALPAPVKRLLAGLQAKTV